MSRLELLWIESSEMAMSSAAIVEGLDVIGHIGDRQFAILVDPLLDPFFLQAAEERFGNGVIPAIALAAHARLEVM